MEEEAQRKPPSNFLLFSGLAFIAALAYFILAPSYFASQNVASEPIIETFELAEDGSEIAVVNSGFGGPKVGQIVPNFVLEDTDGNEVSLRQYFGRPIILNFWATWCGPCRIEMPELQKIYEQYEHKNLVVLALNQDESAETVIEYFYDEMGLTFTPLLDTNSIVATDYGAFRVYPSTYVIDPHGMLYHVHRGAVTAEQLSALIDASLDDGHNH